MKRRIGQPVLWFASVIAAAASAQVATAATYYTPTYIGRRSDLEVPFGSGPIENRTTGDVYSFDSGTRRLSEQDSAALSLPQTTIRVGWNPPTQVAYTMRGRITNDATGTVVGVIPNMRSRSMPWQNYDSGYSTPDANGDYTKFNSLTQHNTHSMYLNSADQLLLRIASDYEYRTPEQTFLYDLKAGTETNLRDLIDPEFWGRYAYTDVHGLSDRGDILLTATPRGEYGADEPWRAETYILTPPGVEAPTPIPEPSLLWLAAVAIGLGFRARSRGKGVTVAA